jgi:hypothetical protein
MQPLLGERRRSVPAVLSASLARELKAGDISHVRTKRESSSKITPIAEDEVASSAAPRNNEEPVHGRKERVLVVLESLMFSMAILSIVICTVVVDLPKLGTDCVLAFFCGEAILRMWAMGVRMYITDPMCAMDFVVTLLDLVCTIASAGMQVSGGRLVRVTRIFKLLKFVRMLKGFRCVRSCYRVACGSKQ